MNESLVKQFELLGWIKVVIIALIAISAIMIIVLLLGRRNFVDTGVRKILANNTSVRRMDNSIIRQTKLLAKITKFIDKTPFRISSESDREYLDYNLHRLNIKVIYGRKDLRADEFNAIVKTVMLMVMVLFASIGLVVNVFIGLVGIVGTFVIASFLPVTLLRLSISARDLEIEENFSDMYLVIHYTLISGARTPLMNVLKSYQETVESKEMQLFVHKWSDYMDTYGEQDSVKYMARDYRDLQQIQKLMRLIKQLYDGNEVKQELIGFRKEVIQQKRVIKTKKMDILVAKAQASFNLLLIILVQAVISAMAIYLPDMGAMGSLF